MKPLRERNQATVGVAALVVIVLACTVAFFANRLPVIGNGTTYTAYLPEAAGLKSGDEVQAAGVKVGEVTDVDLDGNKVLVSFTSQGVHLGERTSADIQIKTMLGDKYLAVHPAGKGELDSDKPIPVSRTSAPFDIPDAIDQLTGKVQHLDTNQLAQSFRTVADTMRHTPKDMGKALNGISKLSQTVASRDQQLNDLLHNTEGVSKVLAQRDQQVGKLIADGNILLNEVQRREKAIDGLLRGTRDLSNQLRGMVQDNQKQLGPALKQLDGVTEVLQRNQDNLGQTFAALAPYVRLYNNTVGNGRWFDGYLCGLVIPPQFAGPVAVNPHGCDWSSPGGTGRPPGQDKVDGGVSPASPPVPPAKTGGQ